MRDRLKKLKFSHLIIWTFLFVGVFHKFIANDLPLVGKIEESISIPIFYDYSNDLNLRNGNVRSKEIESIVKTIVPFHPNESNYRNARQKPFVSRHIMGTDFLGRDVFSRLIYGTWNAVKVGFFSILLALFIAVFVGGIAGYMQDEKWELHWVEALIMTLMLLISIFYFIIEINNQSPLLGITIVIILNLITVVGIKMNLFKGYSKMNFRVSAIFDKLIEVREAIPAVFLVLGCLTLFSKPSLWNIVILIGFISWSSMARYIRAEVVRVKTEDYISAAKVAGNSHFQIIRNHLLPNALDPIIATIAFAVSSAILLEASLSFLGIGVPIGEATWGSMLSEARKTGDWWMVLFPGLAIFLIITSLQQLADRFQSKTIF